MQPILRNLGHNGDMNVFHRQLIRTHLRNLGFAFAALMLVVIVSGLPALLDETPSDPPPANAVEVAGVVLASAFNTVLPLALLVATLFTVGELARYQELTALGAAGWSMLKILRPVIYVALMATLISGALQFLGAAKPPGSSLSSISTSRSARGPQTAAELAEQHASRTYPLMNLFAVLTAIPLASSRRRQTVYSGFGSAIAVWFAYYAVTATTLALGRNGGLPPLLAAWIGPALFAVGIRILWHRAGL